MKKDILVEIAKERFNNLNNQIVHFTGDDDADNYLNDLVNYPHAFVLACLMDRQIQSERAWKIPFIISEKIESKKLNDLSEVNLDEYIVIFNDKNLHRFNNRMAEVFYSAVLKIRNDYGGDALLIWSGKPSSARVVYRI